MGVFRFLREERRYLQDDKGIKYLDALTGIAVCGLGQPNSKVASVPR